MLMNNGEPDFDATAERIYREIGVPLTEPVAPFRIAQHLLGDGAVRLVPATALPGVGAIARVRDRWLVFLREDAPLQAKRFVLCHELAHKLLGVSATEADCDALAAALLVPRPAFLLSLRTHGERLRPLAHAFGTTESCVALRLGETTKRSLALVTPRSVRTRGAGFASHAPEDLRALADRPQSPGIRRVRLGDDRARRMLRIA